MVVRDGEGVPQLRRAKDVAYDGTEDVVRDGIERLLFVTAKELRSYAGPEMLLGMEPRMVFVKKSKDVCSSAAANSQRCCS